MHCQGRIRPTVPLAPAAVPPPMPADPKTPPPVPNHVQLAGLNCIDEVEEPAGSGKFVLKVSRRLAGRALAGVAGRGTVPPRRPQAAATRRTAVRSASPALHPRQPPSPMRAQITCPLVVDSSVNSAIVDPKRSPLTVLSGAQIGDAGTEAPAVAHLEAQAGASANGRVLEVKGLAGAPAVQVRCTLGRTRRRREPAALVLACPALAWRAAVLPSGPTLGPRTPRRPQTRPFRPPDRHRRRRGPDDPQQRRPGGVWHHQPRHHLCHVPGRHHRAHGAPGLASRRPAGAPCAGGASGPARLPCGTRQPPLRPPDRSRRSPPAPPTTGTPPLWPPSLSALPPSPASRPPCRL